MAEYRVVLASGSPRRIEMFRQHGINVEVMPAEIRETLPAGIGAEDAVLFLALKKALCTESEILKAATPEPDRDTVIIAADTVVFKDRILGKPADEGEAFAMLRELRGDRHFVATGVAVLIAGKEYRKVFCEKTEVQVRNYSDAEIQTYIATGEPMDKAGAYAIQGEFGKYIRGFDGSYSNVVGFPWERFEAETQELGICT